MRFEYLKTFKNELLGAAVLPMVILAALDLPLITVLESF